MVVLLTGKKIIPQSAENKLLTLCGPPTLFTHPAWSPDGKQITYAANMGEGSHVYLMNADGSNVVQLTTLSSGQPSWSPDGKQIVFISNGQIYVMKRDGTAVTRVTEGQALRPSWSPDGKRIAYVAYDANNNVSLSIVTLDGTTTSTIANKLAYPSWEESTVWSPDGAQLAFVSDRTMQSEIYLINSNGTGLTQITNHSSDPRANAFYPTWSPDGRQIAFAVEESDGSMLYIINRDGTGLTAIANTGYANEPTWSPDGKRIAFVSHREKGSEIYVADIDGSQQTRLTSNPGNMQCLHWPF